MKEASGAKGKVELKDGGKTYSGTWEVLQDGKLSVVAKNGEAHGPYTGDPAKAAEALLKKLVDQGAFGSLQRPITAVPDAHSEKPLEAGPEAPKADKPADKPKKDGKK